MRMSLKSLPVMILALVAILILRSLVLAENAAPGAAQPSAQAPAQDQTPEAPKLSPMQLFWTAGFFIWPLLGCSILSVTLIIERGVSLRRSRIIPASFLPGLKAIFRDPREDRDRAIQYCEQHDSPIARMLGAGIRRLPRGIAAAEKAIEDAGANESIKLRHNMRFLYSMGSVATLLGLIGTIAGMIKAFQVASVMGPGHADKLSEGIYEAMVNTFAGLAIAIVVTIFYYFFIGRIEKLIAEMNDVVNDFGREYGFDAVPDEEIAVTSAL